MTLGVRGLVTDAEGRVLLVRHTYTDGWHLPGGGIEHGETAIESIKRELVEEGGVEAVRLHIVGFYSNHARFKNDHVTFYRVDEWRPCPPRVDNEIAERGFYALHALPADVTPGTRRRLAEVFDGAPMSEVW